MRDADIARVEASLAAMTSERNEALQRAQRYDDELSSASETLAALSSELATTKQACEQAELSGASAKIDALTFQQELAACRNELTACRDELAKALSRCDLLSEQLKVSYRVIAAPLAPEAQSEPTSAPSSAVRSHSPTRRLAPRSPPKLETSGSFLNAPWRSPMAIVPPSAKRLTASSRKKY